MQNDPYEDVGKFHKKFGLTAFDVGPKEWDPELVEFRLKFLEEELRELRDGVKVQDHALIFDALLDFVYVACGTAHLLGYPWQEGWDLVQSANMSKVRAAKDGSDSKRGSAWDVVKPSDWVAPDIEGLLALYDFALPDRPLRTSEDSCPTCRRDWDEIDATRRGTVAEGFRVEMHNLTFCSTLCAVTWY